MEDKDKYSEYEDAFNESNNETNQYYDMVKEQKFDQLLDKEVQLENAKAQPNATKLSITPVNPKYNKGFLPSLSVTNTATIVIRKLITPIPVVAYIAFKLESKPAILKIVGA